MKNSPKLLTILLLLIGLAYILSPLASSAKDNHKEWKYEYEREDEDEDDDDHYEYGSSRQALGTDQVQSIVSSLDQTQQQLAEQHTALEARRLQLAQQQTQQQQLAEQLANVEKQLSEQRAALEAKAQQLALQKSQQDAFAKQLEQEERQLSNKKQSPVSNAIKDGILKVATIFSGSAKTAEPVSAQNNSIITVEDENRNGISDILEGFLRIARR